jgi:hypothetical protein
MLNSDDKIKQLEKQIAFLTAELQRTKEKSDSLWFSLVDSFSQDNPVETAEVYAEEISMLISSWANFQREKILKRVVETGSMPPYTDCLNDLARSVSPPGKEPPEMYSEESIPVSEPQVEGPPSAEDPSQHMRPKKRTVNVPKAIPGAVPLALSPSSDVGE